MLGVYFHIFSRARSKAEEIRSLEMLSLKGIKQNDKMAAHRELGVGKKIRNGHLLKGGFFPKSTKR